ncbi:CBO0543 family protein [Sporomusa sp.]|uniref:CBO0543 family protein n=1 Tax=Sporomusa sp. TaxID=2078658 RepID=UPI002BEAB4C3|nr:CBO0543 family protein [Sporomusa sp.]HWR07132.1 CBO0543 family protein [Sporomusa sp.]
MLLILLFRVLLLSSFLITAYKIGDWKNRQRYYPTILFVMVVSLAESFATYHHVLWNYNPGLLVKTHTTVEFLNAFVLLPSVTFIFLSKYPFNGTRFYQSGYITLWVLIFSSIELIAHYIIGSISYKNAWSWSASFILDIALFSITRLHYSRPVWAWVFSLIVAITVLIVFDFRSGEFK